MESRVARFLVGFNDNRSWEERTAADCRRVGLDPNVPHIDLVGTARLLAERRLLDSKEFQFIINSNRPVTSLIERCRKNKLDFIRVRDDI